MGENGIIQWNKTYNPNNFEQYYGNSVTQTQDGGYLLAGAAGYDSPLCYYAFIIKTDELGNMEWKKTFGNEGDNNQITSVIQLNNQSFVFGGFSNADYWLFKTDDQGNLLWNKIYGHPSTDEFSWSMIQTSDEEFLLGGEKRVILQYTGLNRFVKVDKNGEEEWNTTVTHENSYFVLISAKAIQTDNTSYMTIGATSGFYNDYNL